MKLPEKRRKELEKQGKRDQPPPPGGGAMGRLKQFERERGMEGTGLDNPATETDAPSRRESGGEVDSE